jgi:hypothetical protein
MSRMSYEKALSVGYLIKIYFAVYGCSWKGRDVKRDGPEYTSGLAAAKIDPRLAEAKRLAVERGFVVELNPPVDQEVRSLQLQLRAERAEMERLRAENERLTRALLQRVANGEPLRLDLGAMTPEMESLLERVDEMFKEGTNG